MARKELTRIAKLEFMAGQAKPGPALAGLGIDMGGFTKDYNNATKEMSGAVVPVEIKCYSDRSYEFVLKTTPASRLILKAAKIEKGSQNAETDKVAKITKEHVREIAEYKMNDLNAHDIEQAMKIIVGTCHNMGIEVEGYKKKEKDASAKKLIINKNYEKQLADMEAGVAEAKAERAAGTDADASVASKDDESKSESSETSADDKEQDSAEAKGDK